MSRSTRIKILLAIDVVFFFVELISGYAVGSLALVADSFHMLNDVMSLIVALYAIKLTEENESDSRYSYGWHRAEILAALVNGVFLLALCFSIFLEALERFFSTPGAHLPIIEVAAYTWLEKSNPQLVVIVGTLGLASNIVGLFLFMNTHTGIRIRMAISSPMVLRELPHLLSAPTTVRPGLESEESDYALAGHPVMTRAAIVQGHGSSTVTSPPRSHVRTMSLEGPRSRSHSLSHGPSENTPLLGSAHENRLTKHTHGHDTATTMVTATSFACRLDEYASTCLARAGRRSGNVGVIAMDDHLAHKLAIQNYFDPVISLVIAIIIFSSSLPLVRSAAFVLQGVPSTVSSKKFERLFSRPWCVGSA
ncbi:unnamed protein product [Mycena citricolor]|uniref:Cation efflux protein transmembrane domain-containing protein n=1 Tax=Mycena citricolor TaxID=2018698 RepID=A0AAD2H095_9AGAR|nr:unnamed protein product [Mycena citricolor]